jgi:hypothetical protein
LSFQFLPRRAKEFEDEITELEEVIVLVDDFAGVISFSFCSRESFFLNFASEIECLISVGSLDFTLS